MDKAGKQYWDKAWGTYDVPKEVNPRHGGLPNHINRRFHEYFCQIFSEANTQGKKILEIGCARSVWLPYFLKEFGFNVTGIDYSEIGCQQAMQILENERVNGKIVCADFFSPPGSMLEVFDVVVSFGVLEHFRDTTACVAAFSKFLKPGGLLITNIPNMLGFNGLLQKIINRPIFDIHIPLNIDTLMRVHQINGLRIISCNYFLFANLGVVNIENLKETLFYKVARLRSWVNEVVWIFERVVPALKPNRWSSPYINCVAVKP
ncbi:MAG TPA: class I SAM-dependent methyltransferase [Syntrophales bacterium]|nr:class I SAM-dependent methyltransferase [Syntrophales bacterium]